MFDMQRWRRGPIDCRKTRRRRRMLCAARVQDLRRKLWQRRRQTDARRPGGR